ncbi:uncharacterized protein LOC131680874 [Topomyia yanbarensis]|uniref:uncharacterized protein LOC131680874 n=1 Tax=Topomyia yanbarensis TaxID=2498891 RepID=UPI00273C0958|nr:uncharacterized protein LOC131680874 [Topomyia yanbarensis]
MSPHGGSGGVPAMSGRGFPALGLIPQRTEGRYLVIQRKDEGQTLEKVSPFLIDKVIRNCCGEVTNVKRIKDGKLLVHTKTDKHAEKLLNLQRMSNDINIAVAEHGSLNTCRVVITCRDLQDENDEVILENLRDQGVTTVYRIMRKQGDSMVKTSTFILTISKAIMPQDNKVGFQNVVTRPYYPRPMRCFQCMQYGHLGKDCKQQKVCANCSEQYHGDNCQRPAKCANCKQNHSTISVDCPIWQRENDIVRVKIDNGISYWEAKKIVDRRTQPEQSFANVVAAGTRKCKCKCSCGDSQTIPTTLSELKRTIEQTQTPIIKPTQISQANPRPQPQAVPTTSYIMDQATKESTEHAVQNSAKQGHSKQYDTRYQASDKDQQNDPPSPSPKPKRTKKEYTYQISSDDKLNQTQQKRGRGRPKKVQPIQHDTESSKAEDSEMEI